MYHDTPVCLSAVQNMVTHLPEKAASVLHFGLVRITEMVGGNNSHLQQRGLYPCWESVA